MREGVAGGAPLPSRSGYLGEFSKEGKTPRTARLFCFFGSCHVPEEKLATKRGRYIVSINQISCSVKLNINHTCACFSF